MRIIIIIPARYNSQRLPGKPLVDIHGKPMIQRVLEQALQVPCFDELYVATDDHRIADVVEGMGSVIMTDDSCLSGSDRCAAAAAKLGLDDDDIVINLQGDMPFVPPRLCSDLIKFTIINDYFPITTLGLITHKVMLGMVHILLGSDQRAILFSRQPFETVERPIYHIGMYGFRYRALRSFYSVIQPELEKKEKLEQLRAIYYHFPIGVMLTTTECGPEVNTKEDLAWLLKKM